MSKVNIRLMRMIALSFMALSGFIGLIAVIYGYLQQNWFSMIFGSMVGGIAVAGVSLTLTLELPGETEEKPEAEQH